MRALDWVAAAVAFILIFVPLSVLLSGYLNFGWTQVIALLFGGHSAYATLRILRLKREAKRLEIEAGRRDRNVCPKCEYDLTGNTSGRCPECGFTTERRS